MSDRNAPDHDRLISLNSLLKTALELPDDERIVWLDALPPESEALRPLLVTLLERASVDTDDFLRRPVAIAFDDISLDEGADAPGHLIGPYRLISELGNGGMATVWLAERIDGTLNRRVALKLPRAGWVPGLAQRMARERDILGALEHPHIARLYDAGVTEEGRPWLAMECVEGISIDRYGVEHGLDVAKRLQLFLQVADAVAYAHGRLIVHRDLKPSNILVTPQGEVRLLDFGVAKLLDEDRAPSTLTQLIGRAVTPDYASPEQLAGRPVTVATDVYSLGIVLFEMLTGTRPFHFDGPDAPTLSPAAREVKAPLASSRVASDGRWSRRLRGDLDTVLAKAMAHSADERYTSVEAFASDVKRHLDGMPVVARPPSARYRAVKFIRRHRLALGAFSAVLIAVTAGLAVAIWQTRVARSEAARAEQVKEFIASILREATVREGVGGVVTASDLLKSAASRIEPELSRNPRVAAELGVIIGEGFSSLGEPMNGEATVLAAARRAEQEFGRSHPITIHAKALMMEHVAGTDFEAADRYLADFIPDALAGLPATARYALFALREQSFTLAKRNEIETSYAILRQAVAIGEQYLGPNHDETVHSLGLLANTYGRFGERKKQLATAEEAVRRSRFVHGKSRPNTFLSASERWYGEALRVNDRPAEAVPILRRVVEDQYALDAGKSLRVRNAMLQLAIALNGMGETAEALALMRECVALEAKQNPEDSDDRTAYLSHLATVLTTARLIDEALLLDVRIEDVARRIGISPVHVALARRARRAKLLAMQGHAEEARKEADAVARDSGDEYPAVRANAWLAAALNARLQGLPRESLSQTERVKSDPKFATFPLVAQANVDAEIGLAQLDLGNLGESERALRRARTLFDRAQIKPSVALHDVIIGLARIDMNTGRQDVAFASLQSLAQEWNGLNPGSRWHREASRWLARAGELRD